MASCRLCGYQGSLVKAHIIPESLYAPLREESKVPHIYSTAENAFPKRSPVGIYDSEILCGECDNRIGDWDNYAQRLLLTPLEAYGAPEELRRQKYFTIRDLDYALLKLFFVSLLWRADQSGHDFFGGVDLGQSWRERTKEMVLTGDPGGPEEIGVTLVRYEHRLAERTIYNPEKVRSDALNFYRFSLGSYVAMIKVDRRPFKSSMQPFVLRPNEHLLVGLFEYEDSRLYRDIVERVRGGLFVKSDAGKQCRTPPIERTEPAASRPARAHRHKRSAPVTESQ